ncbi:MAG TPA: NAD(P)H-dependent glycerol-3-phosphate dehydrogenase [Blastocatellia bacterium]|nr:NAD(P)H-dependent glycerol-3-phosphate dehydrogenase [Blastocatellia bacterium]
MSELRASCESKQLAVIGAGSWGTALSLVAAANHHHVRIWAREEEVARSIQQTGRNPFYLSEFDLPGSVTATTSIEEALSGAEYCVIVVPSHAMREVVTHLREYLTGDSVIVTATKGVENKTLMRMSEVIKDVCQSRFQPQIVVLSGPSFAREVAKGDPTAVVAACASRELAERVQQEFSSHLFRIYTNCDEVGVELGGAVKNVVAIAAGVVRGLGFGTNSAAAIVTRGLAEMTRLALAAGGRPETLAGLAGLGDLVLTCTGELSRNRHVGFELGRGRKLAEILSSMREVAEGVNTTRAIRDLGHSLNVEMPITESVHALLYEDKPAIEAANDLMDRPLKRE